MLQVNSHFKVHKVAVTSLQSVSISRGLVATIEVINKPRLYFKYDDALDVVLTDALNGPYSSTHMSLSLCQWKLEMYILFVTHRRHIASYCRSSYNYVLVTYLV